ncbi:glycosyltransferase [Roseomonas xinghualingensis]|uniref:glycosyltransferase n=1 Tax=Roseomonas xinghualingensis TaxID=2986475 RepID=UPI0021F1D109|nr:glycosyltransferase [Roseomonas sp. SXEYE001]MCV4208674.1 glycosyltransferase [Roseomonas sp. SXEYE001]
MELDDFLDGQPDISAVEAAFALLLGRHASPAGTVAEMAQMPPRALLRRITSSQEFLEKVLPRLVAQQTLPHERRHSSPPATLVRWAIDVAKPMEQTASLMRNARRWHELLTVLLLDPQAGPVITSPAHHTSIIKLLSLHESAAHRKPQSGSPRQEELPVQTTPGVEKKQTASGGGATALAHASHHAAHDKRSKPSTVSTDQKAHADSPGASNGPLVDAELNAAEKGRKIATKGKENSKEIAKTIEDLLAEVSLQTLVDVWTRLEDNLFLKLAKQLFKQKKWGDLNLLYQAVGLTRKKKLELFTMIGRSYIYTQEYSTAAKLLSSLATIGEDDPNIQFYAAVALARDNKLDASVSHGRRALELQPQNAQFLGEQGTILRRLALHKTTEASKRTALLEESTALLQAAILADPKQGPGTYLRAARNLFDLRRFSEALLETDRLLALKPDFVDALMLRGQIFLAQNRVRDALAVAERVIQIDPGHQGATYQLRSLRTLVEDDSADNAGTVVILSIDSSNGLIGGSCVALIAGQVQQTPISGTSVGAHPLQALGALSAEWVLLNASGSAPPVLSADWLSRLREKGFRWCGRLLIADDAGIPVELWRRDLLVGFAEAGLAFSLAELPEVTSRNRALTSTIDLTSRQLQPASDRAGSRVAQKRGTVVVMSKHGIIKFGGGEQFLDSMAEHYKDMGFDPVIVGTRPEMVGQSGVEGGRAFCFVDETPAALRRYFLEVQPTLVHVLSGLGYQVAAALEYLDIPFVYGVHFWRDCLGQVEGDMRFFLDLDRNPVPRPAFRYVLQQAASVYSNSEYTQAVLEECFHARTPIIYSLPRDIDVTETANLEDEAGGLLGNLRDFVLLANAKGEKGFDLLVAVAQLCPDILFVAVSSQSDKAEAEAAVAAAGIANVVILPRTDRIDLLYHRSKIVAVPSYRFVETFSRVCIEAQRYGKPVLGSDRGNVPYLLRQSGVALPEDSQAWAAELRRIYDEPTYYADLMARATENSSRYSYDRQRRAVHGIVSGLGDQILVGIGSGIGNMLHAGPMVRNIAKRSGRKVDIVVAEDHQNSLFLLQNSNYVNTVFSLRQTVLRKKYDQAFITHSFGSARVPFQARRLTYSRDWMSFEPGGPFHETVFNLEAAKALLNIDYDDADITEYFIADYVYQRPPGGRRIGIHGGSKEGFWMSKRWPGYAQLSQSLQRRGFEVASFGIEEEYVEGTLDMTGGTIAEMIGKMMECSYFISNDSGVMNIANALAIPLTALFGPTNPATRGPLRSSSSWLGLTKDCAPCEIMPNSHKTFLAGECRCIAELSYDRVEQHVLSELSRHQLLPH